MCILSILLPSGVARLSTGPIVFAIVFYVVAWTRQETPGGYLAATACVGLLYRWLDFFAINIPERDFWTVRAAEGREKELAQAVIKGKAPSGGWAKLKWFANLWITARYSLVPHS